MGEHNPVPMSHLGAWPPRRVALLVLGWVALAGVAALVCFVQAAPVATPGGGGEAPLLVVEHVPRWLSVGLLPPALLLAAWRWRRFRS
jgi:hypothetical protein